jgi:hypothetical protein
MSVRLLERTHYIKLRPMEHELKVVAQFIRVCSAYNLAEALCISSPVQGSSPTKT